MTVATVPYLIEASGVGSAEWRSLISRMLVGMDSVTDNDSEFMGDLRCRTVADIRFADLTATPSESRHIRSDIRAAYMLCYQVSGSGTIEQDGRIAHLEAGDLAVFATHRPSRMSMGADFRSMSLRVPADLLDIPPGRIDQLTATTIAADSGFAPSMGAYFGCLADLLDTLTPDSRQYAMNTAVGLFSTLVHVGLDAGARAGGWGRAALKLEILDFIEEQLPNAALSTVMIAESHFISVRHLHNLFRGDDDTVGAYIRGRRLGRCEQDLKDPGQRDVPVATIARRWGFESPSHFGQIFREQRGETPASFRRRTALTDQG